MTSLKIGDTAPAFSLPANGEQKISLEDFKGRNVIIYFYPKDETSGCTKEACDFRDGLHDFQSIDAQIIGVSKDSVESHDKFADKYNLPFPLVSDENGTMCEDYGVWVEKSMYGRKYMGIERTTFLIDQNGKIAHIWNKVKVPDHVKDVMRTLKAHKAAA